MHFMNTWDIEDAMLRFADHPILGPAARTLHNLEDVVNRNSDGWAYWAAPVRAADKLMTLIEGDGSWDARHGVRDDATEAQLRKAYTPIRAFLTRHRLTCELVAPAAP